MSSWPSPPPATSSAASGLSVDLTSIEKKGSTLPFVRVYNEVHGIHLVVLFAEYGPVKFPVGYRVYKGKGTATPVTLARELLRTVPDRIRGGRRSE